MASDLVISVGANIAELERQMRAAGQTAQQQAEKIEAEFARRNPSFAGDLGVGALKGLGAAIAGVGLERITSGILAANKEIASFAQTARQAGIEVQRFQELRAAAGSLGIGGKEFDGGLGGLAKALNDSRSQETELSRVLDANNIKLKDREGRVLSTNEALAVAADLINRAATEQDKIKFAEAFGLPADFVPLLEKGAGALNEMATKARDAGGVLDAEVIAKAAEFDKAWTSTWNTFGVNGKAAISEAVTALAQLSRETSAWFDQMTKARAAAAAGGAALGSTINALAQGGAPVATAPVPAPRPAEGVPWSSQLPPVRPGDLGNPSRYPGAKSGGGGGGGKSDEEKRSDEVDRYIKSLERQQRILEAEASTLGKSRAERAAAIELARIGVVTDEEQKGKIEAIVTANEALRVKIAQVSDAQRGLVDAQKYFGNAAVDAFEDLIINGAKAEDVVKRLASSLAKAALQALLIGEGPIGGIFGIVQGSAA